MRSTMICIGILAIWLFVASVNAAVPPLMNYQGKLTDENGVPVPDGNYTIWFRIYDDSTGGNVLWEELRWSVPVANALFNILLGDSVPIPDTVFTESVRWLGIQVSPDPELTPRKPIVSVGYSFRALDADSSEHAVYSDTADYTLFATPDNDWIISGGNIYREQGNVGIGTANPAVPLHVAQQGLGVTTARFDGTHGRIKLEPSWSATENRIVTLDSVGATRDLWISGRMSQNLLTIKSSGNIGIGTSSPDTTLHVFGNIKMVDGNQGADKVLTSDADGVGSWQTTAGGSNWTVTDSVLYTNKYWGIARGSAGNVLYGDSVHTMVNLGVACTTGALGSNDYGCTVSGGHRNRASSQHATVGGGSDNRAWANWGTVGGGRDNMATSIYATVGGGLSNSATTGYSTIGGGQSNSITSTPLESDCGTVAGGCHNTAHGWNATVGGGSNNGALEWHTTVSGGIYNTALVSCDAVGGGSGNSAGGPNATVGGGCNNSAYGAMATVGGGSANTTSWHHATVSGGTSNTASGECTTIGGGYGNTASDSSATVSGGSNNDASGKYATVGGGRSDTATALYGGVFSGYSNMAGDESADTAAFVGGGYDNSATAKYATVSGGWSNNASGIYATVGGGSGNTAAGDFSFAIGHNVVVDTASDCTFAFGRGFATSTPNAVIFHNSVNPIKVGIGTTSPGERLTVAGKIESTDGGVKFPDGSVQSSAAAVIFNTSQIFSGAAPTSWADLDLSSLVGSQQALVMLKVKNIETTLTEAIRFRKNGDADEFCPFSGGGVHSVQLDPSEAGYVVVVTDSYGIIEWTSNHGYQAAINLEACWK